MGATTRAGLVAFARELLVERIEAAGEKIWLASPFISFPVAKAIAEATSRSQAQEKRLLTALDERSVAVGVLDPRALERLQEAEFEIASIENLHAKVSLVDSDWGLVGSGNLTGKGLGDEGGGGNHELGVILAGEQIEAASAFFQEWWTESEAVSASEIERYKLIPPIPRKKGLGNLGPELPVGDVSRLQRFLSEPAPNPSPSFWVDANYHDPDDPTWWDRDWISGQPEVAYVKGDLLVIYLGAENGGPKNCPAILQATTSTRHDPAFVAANRDDPQAPGRWPNVTETTILGEVSLHAGIPLETIGRSGESLRRGYLRITRAEFEQIAAAMITRV